MAATTYEDVNKPSRDTGRRPTRVGLIVRLLVVALIVAGLGYGLWFFNTMRNQGIAAFFASNVPPPTTVAAAPAAVGPLPQYLAGIGSTAAIRQVNISPEIEGRVVDILFEPGAVAKRGDPLVQLNDAPERADLANYQAQLKLAEANLRRTQRLANRDFATQATLDQNTAMLEQARAGIAKTEAMIAQKLVLAPFDGELGIREVEFGQHVEPGTNLVTLTDIDRLYVNFTVPEQTRASISVGQTVEVAVDAYPGQSFEARLTTLEPQIDPGTRTIRLQAKMDNSDRRLLPGMFANARIVLPPQPEVVTVAETAVARTLYGDSVFVVREEGTDGEGKPVQKAVQTFVRTGEVGDGRIAILDGVRPGELVVSSGALKLQSGMPVRVTDGEPLPVTAAVLPRP